MPPVKNRFSTGYIRANALIDHVAEVLPGGDAEILAD